MKKRAMACILALTLLLGMLPAMAAAEGGGNSVTVKVAAQLDDGFLYPQKELTVEEGTAAAYGFANAATVQPGTVTALDALVAAHVDKYGAAFTEATAANYMGALNDWGMQTTCFGAGEGRTSGLVVNHEPDMVDGTNSFPLTDGDVVDFFYYASGGSDFTAWLTWDIGGQPVKVDAVTLGAGESLPLTVKGTSWSLKEDQDLSGLGLYEVDDDTQLLAAVGSDGTVELSLDQVGDYALALKGTVAGVQITMPTLSVTVQDGPPDRSGQPNAVTVAESTVALSTGETHQIQTTVLPAGASQAVTYQVVTGPVTVSDQGLITPTEDAASGGTAVIRVKSAVNPAVMATVTVNLNQTVFTTADIDQVLDLMAAKFHTGIEDWWLAVAMHNYAAYDTASEYHITDTAKQKYVNFVAAAVADAPGNSSTLASAINGLCAMGYDPTDITALDGTKYNAVELLKNIDLEAEKAIWGYCFVPNWVLLACRQGDYGTEELEQEVIQFLLDNQEEGGGWSTEFDLDATAMTVQGLARYYDENEEVKAAVDKALTMLNTQLQSGNWTENANSDAMMLLAMASMDWKLDKTLLVGGKNMGELLLSHFDGATFGPYADAQGFPAAVALAHLLKGESHDPFDFSDITTRAPAVAAEVTEEGGSGGSGSAGGDGSSDDQITVSFTLKTHQTTWIGKHDIQLAENATVADAFRQVMDARSDFTYAIEGVYVSSITYGGTTLEEFGQGPNSGWKYSVNGVAPGIAMTAAPLSDGDELVWYYVSDYTQDTDRDEGDFSAPVTAPEEAPEEPALTEEEIQTILSNFDDVPQDHWAAESIALMVDRGLFQGTGEGGFAPDQTADRASVLTVLYRLSGDQVEAEGTAWYAESLAWATGKGVSDGTNPTGPINREQLVVMFWRYLGRPAQEGEEPDFRDWDSVSGWAVEAMTWAARVGLLQGTGSGEVLPQNQASRAELSTFFQRLLDYLERQETEGE